MSVEDRPIRPVATINEEWLRGVRAAASYGRPSTERDEIVTQVIASEVLRQEAVAEAAREERGES